MNYSNLIQIPTLICLADNQTATTVTITTATTIIITTAITITTTTATTITNTAIFNGTKATTQNLIGMSFRSYERNF